MLSWADTADLPDAESRISRLCHWVVTAEQRGARYALSLPGRDIPAATGPTHRDHCLTALAELEP